MHQLTVKCFVQCVFVITVWMSTNLWKVLRILVTPKKSLYSCKVVVEGVFVRCCTAIHHTHNKCIVQCTMGLSPNTLQCMSCGSQCMQCIMGS